MSKKIWINNIEVIVPDNWEELTIKLKDIKWNINKCKKPNHTHERIMSSGISLGRAILNITNSNIQVDHIDGNTFNNDITNLRSCTNQQNSLNRKKSIGLNTFKGVRCNKKTYEWEAQISTITLGRIKLGSYKLITDAITAYDLAAFKYHKEFAKPNYCREHYEKIGLL